MELERFVTFISPLFELRWSRACDPTMMESNSKEEAITCIFWTVRNNLSLEQQPFVKYIWTQC